VGRCRGKDGHEENGKGTKIFRTRNHRNHFLMAPAIDSQWSLLGMARFQCRFSPKVR
jgi:hypothetical protein